MNWKATTEIDFQQELKDSIEQTLYREARRNELTISYVRVIGLGITAFIDYLVYLQGSQSFSITNFYLAASWLMFAVVTAMVLRRGWYHSWLRTALPLADALMIFSLTSSIYYTSTEGLIPAGVVVNTGIGCAFLAILGALRLTRMSAWVATALATMCFAGIGVQLQLPIMDIIFTCMLLTAAGFIGMWIADIVRRAVESEVARLILTRFLPEELVEGIHNEPFSMLTHPRVLQASVLVSDLRNFTRYSEGLPPEEVLSHLNTIQGTLAATVLAHGGRVDKFMGDGMLAVFGISEANTDHARQSIDAAVAMVTAVKELDLSSELPIRVGIGIHTGPVVAGCLGSGMRLEFTVIGDTVNTASRLESLTKEMGVEILLSDEVRKSSTESQWKSSLTSMGEVHLRGKQIALEAFSITALQ